MAYGFWMEDRSGMVDQKKGWGEGYGAFTQHPPSICNVEEVPSVKTHGQAVNLCAD